MRQALSALTALSTTGLVLSATLVACSLSGGDDDDDGNNGGQGPGSGGSVVAFTGGASSTTGGASGTNGGSSNTSGGNGNMPEECPANPLLSECGVAKQTADVKVVNMMLVVDKSASMLDKPTGFADNKWVSLGTALKSALAGVQEQMNLGLVMYPFGMNAATSDECAVADGAAAVSVPIGPGTQTVSEIVRIVENTAPSGGTPTAAALKAAYNYFTTGAGATMTGSKYVLLATDGGPNCNGLNTSCRDSPDLCTVNLDGMCTRPNCCITGTGMLRSELCLDNGAVVDAILQLKNAGVTTYVVGIPGTEVYSKYLDQFADASGQISPTGPSKYYEVKADGGVAALTATFSGIVTQLVRSCDIALDPAPDDPTLVNVAIDCELKKSDDPTGGWTITPDGKTLQLKGTTCERVQTSGAKRIDLYYGCRPPA